MADGRVVIDTKLDTSGVESGIRSINNLLKAGFVTKGLSYLKEAISFVSEETGKLNDSIRMASTLFGDYDVDLDKLAKNLRTISNETQVAASDLGMGLYNALSSGIPASEDMGEALEYVRKNALTAKAGMADLDSTVRASASVMNAYGMTVDDTDRILGIMMNTQNLGITTIGELSTTLAQVIPTAAAFGVSFEEVGAALATMTAMGTQTAQATTGLNNLLSELGRQSQQGAKNLAAAADAAGLGKKSFSDLVDEGYSLTDILLLMQRYAEQNGQSLIDMFGSIEGGRAALQLVTQDGEKFTSNLESMYHTEGMVEEASGTVMTATDRLGQSIANAASSIGQKLLPAWNFVAGGLADGIDALSGNAREAKSLEAAFDDLSEAAMDYKTAQEAARRSTDETTQAMRDQSAAAYTKAALEMVDSFDASQKAVAGYRTELENAQWQFEHNNGLLNEMAETLTGITGDTDRARAELAELAAAGRLNNIQMRNYEYYAQQVTEAQKAMASATASLEKEEALQQSTVDSLVAAYADGIIDITMFRDANHNLYTTVVDAAEYYRRGAELIGYADFPAEELEHQIGLYEKALQQVEEGTPLYYQLKGALDALREAYEALGDEMSSSGSGNGGAGGPVVDADSVKKVLERYEEAKKVAEGMFSLMGDEADYVQDSISALESAISGLIKAGLEPTDEQVVKLAEDLKEMKDRAEGLEAGEDAVQAATDRLNESIRGSKVEFELFGDETKLVEDELAAFETALQELVEAGLDETDVRVQTLADTIGRLRGALEETKSPIEELGETFKDTFADADMWIGLVSDGIQSAVGAMLEAPERIAELQESTLEAMESLREAQEELSEAKARGDKEAIRNLEEQVKGYNDIIAANKEEEKALKSGEEGWKAFGRSALKALAQVLYGLGEQLAAQAVAAVAKFPQDWVAFGLATAGSLAAIGAGIALDAAAGSFQEGGIVPQVPGVPSTGDRHVAMVNPGELILNRAQQDSIAGQLVTAEAQRALTASAGGSTIVVNLTGAYIYGLDEPAVGRAIYENIRTLQSEGVLR